MIKKFNLFIIFLSISICAIGQNQITGRIIDKDTKKPVKEALVIVQDKNIETTSNFLGYFQISADTSDFLIIEKPFYETGLVKVPTTTGIQIQINKRKQSDYQGGFENFYRFLGDNIGYPQMARRNGTQGRLYISFTIDSLGQMSNIKTIKDIGNGCALEVSDRLREVPNRWIPSETTTTFILPVTFRIGNSKIKLKEIELPQGVLLAEIVITAFGIERR